MRFSEVDLLGVLISPLAPILLAAWLLLLPVRALISRAGLLDRIWHPALFVLSLYVLAVAAVTLLWPWLAVRAP